MWRKDGGREGQAEGSKSGTEGPSGRPEAPCDREQGWGRGGASFSDLKEPECGAVAARLASEAMSPRLPLGLQPGRRRTLRAGPAGGVWGELSVPTTQERLRGWAGIIRPGLSFLPGHQAERMGQCPEVIVGSRWRIGKAPNPTVPGQVLNGLFLTPVEGHSGLSCLWPSLPTRHQIPGDARHRGQPLSPRGILTLCPQWVLTDICGHHGSVRGGAGASPPLQCWGEGGHEHCVLHQLLVQQGTGGSTHPSAAEDPCWPLLVDPGAICVFTFVLPGCRCAVFTSEDSNRWRGLGGSVSGGLRMPRRRLRMPRWRLRIWQPVTLGVRREES